MKAPGTREHGYGLGTDDDGYLVACVCQNSNDYDGFLSCDADGTIPNIYPNTGAEDNTTDPEALALLVGLTVRPFDLDNDPTTAHVLCVACGRIQHLKAAGVTPPDLKWVDTDFSIGDEYPDPAPGGRPRRPASGFHRPHRPAARGLTPPGRPTSFGRN